MKIKGLSFAVSIEHDSDMRAPWIEHDGHGSVRECRSSSYASNRPFKQPGERFLSFERAWGLAYDWQGTMRKARAEGWGLSDENRAKLAAKLGREPRGREVVAESVRLDFEHLRAWANNEWHWVGVIVELLDVDGNGTGHSESLWGIESENDDYHQEVAQELAEQIADSLGRKKWLDLGARRIRVRA